MQGVGNVISRLRRNITDLSAEFDRRYGQMSSQDRVFKHINCEFLQVVTGGRTIVRACTSLEEM